MKGFVSDQDYLSQIYFPTTNIQDVQKLLNHLFCNVLCSESLVQKIALILWPVHYINKTIWYFGLCKCVKSIHKFIGHI